MPTGHEKKLLVDLAEKLRPDIVGISVRSTFFPVAKDITALIKSLSRVPVIWGGAHPTVCPEESIRFADMICIGEGEKPLLELADKLANKQDATTIRGLWVNTDGTVVKNPTGELLQDLDSLPLPEYNFDNNYIIEDGVLEEGDPYYNDNLTHYNFMTARGCPFQCDFCSNSVLKEIFRDRGSFIRQRSVANIITELKYVKSRFKKLQVISSNDEVFTLNKNWLTEFCRLYKKELCLPFHCDIHPSSVTEEVMAMMNEAGLKTVSLGVQSGSERIRRELYGRNTSDEQIKEAGRIFKKFGIFPSYDLIFDNPLETKDEMRKTLGLMLSLPRPFRINMYSLQYHPRTKLTEKFLREEIIKQEDIDGKSLKGFNQWHVRLDWKKQDPGIVHAYKIFLLLSTFVNLSKKDSSRVLVLFPKFFIRYLAGSRFFMNNHRFTDWITFLPKVSYGISLILQGEFSKLMRGIRKLLPRAQFNQIRRK